jgi:hypothetical protein
MVYMEPTALGIEPLLTSWLQSLPPGIAQQSPLLSGLFRCGFVGLVVVTADTHPSLLLWRAEQLVPHSSDEVWQPRPYMLLDPNPRALVPGCLSLVRKHLKEAVPTVSHNLVSSLFRLLDSLLEEAGFVAKRRGATNLLHTGSIGCSAVQ